MTVNHTAAIRRVEAARKELERLEAELREAHRPVEPHSVVRQTVVVTFSKWFGGDREYQYAAIRPIGIAGLWSVTGKGALTSVPWERLLDFVEEKETDSAAIESVEEIARWSY